MADVQSVDIQKKEIIVNLKVSKAEYDLITNHTTDLVLLPTTPNFMIHSLTTGKLGNSNRIMMPKKILEKFEIKNLDKKVPAKTFKLHDDVFLIIRLKKSTFGIPVFKDGE